MFKRYCLMAVIFTSFLYSDDTINEIGKPDSLSVTMQDSTYSNRSGLLLSIGGGVGYSSINIASGGNAFPNLFGKIIARLGSDDGINLFRNNPKGDLDTILNGALNLKIGYQQMINNSLAIRGYGNIFIMSGAAILPGYHRQYNYPRTNRVHFRDDDYDNIYLPMNTLDFSLNLDALYFLNRNFGIFAGIGVGFYVDPMGFVASSMVRGSGLLLNNYHPNTPHNGFYNAIYSGSVNYTRLSIPINIGVTFGNSRHKFETFVRIPTLSSGIHIVDNNNTSFIHTNLKAFALIFSYTFVL